ncbi:MAG: histidine kinase [Desulfococcus sp. 4484_241]|nr:MAG: histidine kinase [Desulfococcus sp. 4484_241]RLC30273.1 MAG: cytidylate kinase-like family protein [Deltaproteobacteria bacterium]
MSVITISRGSYSRGKEVAEKIAEKLGYKCISRDLLIEASETFNIPEIKLVRAIHDAPSVLERFTHGKEKYVSYIRKVLLEHVRRDNMVYHGLAGHYFLLNVPNVLKVRIIADMEDRIREEMKRENIPYDKARYLLRKDDDERRKWGLKLYGIDTWDSSLYDMVLHIKDLTVDDAVDLIIHTVGKPAFQTTPRARKIIDDLLLEATVQAELVKVAPRVNVTAHDGVVFVGESQEALTLSNNDLDEIRRIVKGIEGVRDIHITVHNRKEAHDSINPFHNL